MTESTSSAVNRAIEYLEAVIPRVADSGASRLPTAAVMAARAGVSVVTMLKAVRCLRDRGLLSVRHGAGIHVASRGSPMSTRSRPDMAPCKWQRLRERVRCDLLCGSSPSEAVLPTIKELSSHYGADRRTVRKALDSLLEEGLLETDTRGFRLTAPAVPMSSGVVRLLVRAQSSGRVRPLAPRLGEQYRAVQRACSLAGVRLEIVPFQVRGAALCCRYGTEKLRLSRAQQAETLGFMVWTQALEPLNLPWFIERLCRYGRPVAVLDNSGALSGGLRGSAARFCRIVQVGLSAGCGHRMGRFLLSLGHRQVVYLDAHGLPMRRAGLHQAFSDAGHGHAVAVERGALRPEKDTVDDNRVDIMLREARIAFGIGDEKHRQYLEALESLRDNLEWELGYGAHREQVRELYERARSHRDATAWVCSNDELALQLLRCAREHGPSVPESVSVVGFDDTEEAFLEGLTSYNFNVTGVVNTLVNHILRPSMSPVCRERCVPEELDGYLSVRGSSGPVRRGKG